MMQVTRPALMLFRPCLGSIGIIFLHPKIFGALFLMQIVTLTGKLSCGNFLRKNCRGFFYLSGKKKKGVTKMKFKKLLCLLLSIIVIIATSTVSLANSQTIEETDIYDVISEGIGSAEAYLCEKLTEIHNDSGVGFGSDWAIITLLRAGKTVDSSILDEYTLALTEEVRGWDENIKPTDAAKAVLSLTVLDKDVADVEVVNLINFICNSEKLESATNELAYLLLALYASNTEIPQDAVWSKSAIIDKLLTFQTESGGFGLFDSETTDTDMTAICVQALAPYINEHDVAQTIDKAVVFLKDTISESWDYDDNPNTTAQVLLAISALGIDVTEPDNGFGANDQENIVTSLERYRNTGGNGYLFGDSVNTLATYQVMQAYDAYRKIHKDNVSYWDFGTDGEVYDDQASIQKPAPEENTAEPVDVFVTIVDDGNIVNDKNGVYVAQAKVTVFDCDQNGILTVDEALYATHEALYDGGAESGYSTFVGDYGLSLAILWGKGTSGVSASAGYYLNNASCWSLSDAVSEGDYLTAFNYYDTIFWRDSYSYFDKNTASVNKDSSVTLALKVLGYDESWNQVTSPYADANVMILENDNIAFTTDAEGQVKITTSQLQPGIYYAVAYTDAKNIVPAVCKITVEQRKVVSTGGGGGSAIRKPDKEDISKVDTETKFGLEGKNGDITYKPVVIEGKTFADIADCTGKAEIEALAQRGIINGKTEENYDPYATMTRAEFATIVVNALGLPQKEGIVFTDVKDDEWYAKFIKTAYHYGIVKGISQNEFNPQGTITLEEAAVMVERAAKLSGIKTDIEHKIEGIENNDNISDWALYSLEYCIGDGILGNDTNDVNPKKNVTREDIAVILYKMLGKAKLI